MKLQINTTGAWRNVAEFDAGDRQGVIHAVGALHGLLPRSKWALLHDDGRREWLQPDQLTDWARWREVTPTEPAPLDDVMITCENAPDEPPLTYMAYRDKADPSRWYLSGTDNEEVMTPYAWAPCLPAAPIDIKMRRAAA